MKPNDRMGAWVLEKQLGRGMTASTWLATEAGRAVAEATERVPESRSGTSSAGSDISALSFSVEGSPGSEVPAEQTGAGGKEGDHPSAVATGTTRPRRAVLKILDLKEMADWNVAELFRRESETLASLSHPRIPKFIEAFEEEQGGNILLVLAMEYMEGSSLEALVRSGRRFTDEEVASILAGLAEILAYLSSLRPPVVHRDVNPRNILLAPDGSVRLVDFSGARDAVRASLYPGATLVGTAGYTAPEQVAGRASTRSDLYGAATTAVFLLTGLNPAELPARNMKIDLSGVVQLSAPLARVLDSWLEGDQDKRLLAAGEAVRILRGEIPPVSRPEPQRKPESEFDEEASDFATLRDRVLAAIGERAGLVDAEIRALDERSDAQAATLPRSSRVRIERSGDRLLVVIPPGSAKAAGLGVFTVFWLGFVAFWTMTTMAMRAPFFFTLFSLPFWGVGIFMGSMALKTIAGTSELELGSDGLVFREKLLGKEKSHNHPLADIGAIRIVTSSVRVQDQTRLELDIETVDGHIKLGAGLSRRELEVIGAELAKHKKQLS